MTDPRDEARQRADWQANQCATQHLQPCNAHHCTLARDVLAGLDREQKWEGLLINSRELREKAEARVAELEAEHQHKGREVLMRTITSLRKKVSDLEEALRAIRDCSLPAIHGSNANEQKMRAIAAGALKPEEPKPAPESVAEQEARHNRERLKLQAESWAMAEWEEPAPPLGSLRHEFVPCRAAELLPDAVCPFSFGKQGCHLEITFKGLCGQPEAAHRAKEEK